MARPHPALFDLAGGRPLGRIEDPGALLASAWEHKMHGLLWEEVRSGSVSLPPEAERTLAQWQLRAQAHHRRLWESLEAVTLLLRERGIEVASAKGVTAEQRWYPRLGTRPSLDVDLLLRPSDVRRADEVVAAVHPGHPLQGEVAGLAAAGLLQSIDLRDQEGTHLDLHFDILKWEVDTRHNQRLWDRLQTLTSPGGVLLSVLDPETSLIHFLLHLNKDRFSYLLGFVDVVRILEREDLDWDFVDRFLRGEGFETHLYLALDTVMDTVGLEPPGHPPVSGWRAALWRRLWPERVRLGGDVGLASHHRRQYWIGLTARGRSPEAAQRWLRRVFPPRTLLDYYHRRFSGPYPWHLIRGRIHTARQRRAMMARLR